MDGKRGAYLFDDLLEEIQKAQDELNQQGASSFMHGDHKRAEELLSKAKQLAHFMQHVRDAKEQWSELFPGKRIKDVEIQKTIAEINDLPIRKIADANTSVCLDVSDGSLKHSYLIVSPYKDFFPNEAYGGSSERDGLGKPMTFHVEGLPGPIETDIAADKMFFRKRGWLRDFYEMHRLKPGDQVQFEKISEYTFKVRPVKKIL
jgi:hypothetical protein